MEAPTEKIPFAERRALRVPEAIEYSGLGRTSIYDAIRDGIVESTKIGARRLIMRASLDRLISPKP
jgi:excisionase family DNA binding protein